MVILGLGTLAIPFTHGPVTLAIIAVVMSFGNGIGSGIMMTLGADVAPSDDRNSFLAIFRLISDLGGSFGPFVPSVIAAVHAGYRHRRARGDRAGWCGGPALARWVPRYSSYATPSMVREHHRLLAEREAAVG